MITKTKHCISWLLALMILFQPMSIGVFAASDEYVILDMYSGFMAISGVDSNSTAISSDESVARFENGHIQAYNCGVATITIGNKVYKVSVIASYPQPKTAKVNKAGVLLRQWGAYKTSDVITTLKKDEEITILGRVDDKTAAEGVVTQYVETSNGKRGFIENKENTDRPIADYAIELSAGETAISGTYNGTGDYYQNQTFATSSNNITVKKNTDHSATITGVSEGLALFTSTGNNGVKTTAFVTVYSEVSYTAVLNQKTVVKQGANESSRSSSVKQKGEIVTITGQCGDYWRIGQKQYVLKACADIQPDNIVLDKVQATMFVRDTLQLSTIITPAIAQKSVVWHSNDEGIATVDVNGKVTAWGAGECVISAITSNGLVATCNVVVNEVMPESIVLNETEIQLNKTETFDLVAIINPDYAVQDIEWISSNESVASVVDGSIVAEGAGEATITATTVNNLTATCSVIVKVPLESIAIQESIILSKGKTHTLLPQLFPEDTTQNDLKWTSNNESVATVNSKGEVTARDAGEATITVSCGTVTATCVVEVYIPLDKVQMQETLNLEMGETIKLSPVFVPANTTETSLSWKTSDANVATVDNEGNVIAKNIGQAVITVSTQTGQTLTCTVTVFKPISSITLPQYCVVKINNSTNPEIVYTPRNQYGNKITLSSEDSSVAEVLGNLDGITVKGKKQGVANFTVKSIAPISSTAPSGVSANVVSASTLVSVYKDSDVKHVATIRNNTTVYHDASGKYVASAVSPKYSLLKVIGECGSYYYVSLKSNNNKKFFVKKTDVEIVNLLHKELLINQRYNPFKNKKIKKVNYKYIDGNENNLGIDKDTMIISAKKNSKSVLRVVLNQESIYQIHITSPEQTVRSIGYTKEEVKVYKCAQNSCLLKTLNKGVKIEVVAILNQKAKIKYIDNGKEKIGYVKKESISWISAKSVVGKADKTKTIKVVVNNLTNTEKDNKTVYDKTDNKVFKVQKVSKVDGKRKVVLKTKNVGYRTLRISVGKYETFVPVSVFKSFKQEARIRRISNIRMGANKNTPVYRKLLKDRSVKIIGKSGNFFYVDTSNSNIGKNGKAFVAKADISYLVVKKNYKTVKLGSSKNTINVKAYNITPNKLQWTNLDGIVQMKRNKQDVHTIKYKVVSKKVGATKVVIKHKNLSLKDNCFISVYKKMNNKPGFMKSNDTARKCATNNSDYPNLGNADKYKKVTVLGKCGDYYYVKAAIGKSFVKKEKVAYLNFSAENLSMKCYNTKKNIKANLVNSNKDNKIKISVDKEKYAEVKKQVVKNSVKKVHLYAKKNGKVTLTASYTNAGDVTIKKKIKIKISDVKFLIKYEGKKNLVLTEESYYTGDLNPQKTCPTVLLSIETTDKIKNKVDWFVNGTLYKKGEEKIECVLGTKGKHVITASYGNSSDSIRFNVIIHKKETKDSRKEYLDNLNKLMQCALQICNNNVQDANDLVYQYMRDGEYDTLYWSAVSGPIDLSKVNELRKLLNITGFFLDKRFIDPYNNNIDIRHLCASLDAYKYDTGEIYNFFTSLDEKEVDLAASIGGDLASGVGNYLGSFELTDIQNGYSFVNMRELYFEDNTKFPNMSTTDILEDIDAYNIYQKLEKNKSVTFFDAFVDYYKNDMHIALDSYTKQYKKEEWESNIKGVLNNAQVKKIVESGIDAAVGDNIHSKYMKYYSENFLNSVGKGFLDFIATVYVDVRG